MDLGTIGKQQFDLENKFKPFTGKQMFFLLARVRNCGVSVAIRTSPSHLWDNPNEDIAPAILAFIYLLILIYIIFCLTEVSTSVAKS